MDIGFGGKTLEWPFGPAFCRLQREVSLSNVIPVFRPSLVNADKLVPWLRKIDQNRWYTNFGPLTREFEARMAQHLGVDAGQLATVANGTAALTAAIETLGIPLGSRCLLPSWTFVATVAAVRAAGLEPCFVDVSEETWALDPTVLRDQVAKEKAALVVVVSPFGAPLSAAAWEKFRDDCGVPVVIDAAASFDSVGLGKAIQPGRNPIMVSLHATKTFGIGEGALVLSEDTDYIARLKAWTNFGFHGSRVASVPGVNAKISEYTAAIGLATLEGWDDTRAGWLRVTEAFMQQAARVGAQLMPGYGAGWIASYGNVILPEGLDATRVMKFLGATGIDSRQWWDHGCHRQPAYAQVRRLDLSVTEKLARRVIGLPYSIDIIEADLERVFLQFKAAINAQ